MRCINQVEELMYNKLKFLFVVSCSFAVCYGITVPNVQFDIRNLIIASERVGTGSQALTERSWNFDNDIYTIFPASPYVSIYFRERLEGSTMYMAMPERIIPLNQRFALGMQVEKNALFHFGITLDALGRADSIRPYYFTSVETTVTQKMLSSANVQWDVSGRKVDFFADFTYFRLNYDLRIEEDDLKKAIDDDLWSDIDFGFKPNDELSIGFGTLLKNDFNKSGDFDYGDHYIGIEGDHTINLVVRKFYLKWRFAEHYRISQALYRKDDAEGPATVIYLRPVLKMKKKWFLKGVAKYDLSGDMQKQWYEFLIRKAWKTNSSFDLGYWTVLGSYFPRQGLKARFTIYAGPIGFIPDVQVYLRKNRDTNETKFYRTTSSFETLVNINRVDIYGGYTYSYYKDLKDREPFASRGVAYFGVRKW